MAVVANLSRMSLPFPPPDGSLTTPLHCCPSAKVQSSY
ncbi:hypothetical protein RSAG8_06731, partial [Rhizoctonia solani AG-8 WAC10335]